MDLMQAVKERHSVRKYADKAINEQLRGQIVEEIAKCNQEADLIFKPFSTKKKPLIALWRGTESLAE